MTGISKSQTAGFFLPQIFQEKHILFVYHLIQLEIIYLSDRAVISMFSPSLARKNINIKLDNLRIQII